jgi:hypothetical protein
MPSPRNPSEDILYVNKIGGHQGPGQEGFSGTKDLLRSIREEYPWATGISGLRVSGGRGKAGSTGDATMYFTGKRFDPEQLAAQAKRATERPEPIVSRREPRPVPRVEDDEAIRRGMQELLRGRAPRPQPAPVTEDLEAMVRNLLQGINPAYRAFAEGGVVDRPTVGLLGENGPEAVIPLGPHHQMMPLADRMRAAGVPQSQNIEYRGQGPTAADLISIYMDAMRTGLLGKAHLPAQDTDNPLSQALGVAGIRPHYAPRQGSQASLSGYPSRSLLQ